MYHMIATTDPHAIVFLHRMSFDKINDADSVDDEDDYSDEEEHNDSNNDNDDAWNLKSLWRQHSVAIMVALVAATISFYHLKTTTTATPTEMMILSVHELRMHQHVHLNQYERMANVSFCSDRLDDITDNRLHSMLPLQLRFSQEMIHSLIYHYTADSIQDDDYSKVSTATTAADVTNAEFHCMTDLAETHLMTLGSTWVYQTPTIQEISNDPNAIPASISFTGFAAKFFNLSPKPILLHWDGTGGHGDSSRLVAEIAPMEAVGTATTPGQGFYVSPVYDGSHALQRWTLTSDEAIVVYEDTERKNEWKQDIKLKFQLQKLNLLYARDYLVVAKKTWLAHFPRPPPMHHMWDARTMGQAHHVSSDASHHISEDNRAIAPIQLKLTATSVAPRVLEIDSFLSKFECQLLIQLAKTKGLQASTVVTGSRNGKTDNKTRSSTNTWIDRDANDIVDTIYRRAADVFNIDDALMRHRTKHHDDHAGHASLAESLQVVRYIKKQGYTPHHDFTYPSITNRYQPSRFATLLVYLNTVAQGGETTFPCAINNKNHDGLSVKPVMGKAVLFYNMLPDGNFDDLSQHGSNPVEKGEKWVANMWVWDPLID